MLSHCFAVEIDELHHLHTIRRMDHTLFELFVLFSRASVFYVGVRQSIKFVFQIHHSIRLAKSIYLSWLPYVNAALTRECVWNRVNEELSESVFTLSSCGGEYIRCKRFILHLSHSRNGWCSRFLAHCRWSDSPQRWQCSRYGYGSANVCDTSAVCASIFSGSVGLHEMCFV